MSVEVFEFVILDAPVSKSTQNVVHKYALGIITQDCFPSPS